MRTVILVALLCAAAPSIAQDPAAAGYTMDEPQMMRLRPGATEPTPEWYLYKAGDNYNTGIWALLAGGILGTGLLFSSSEGQQMAGAVVLGAGFGVGMGFFIGGNGKLMRAGWLQSRRLQLP
jgi:hypothetical protein